ncbi:hypothetical protein C5P09_10010 [Escherichia coli]|nr:hypothetical protein C5P09_10010 [Escherichia coli]
MVYKMRYRSQHPYSIKEKQMKSEVLSVKEKIGYGMGDAAWICPYISRHLSSLNPLLARCRRYSRGER